MSNATVFWRNGWLGLVSSAGAPSTKIDLSPPAWYTATTWCQLPSLTLVVEIGVSSIVYAATPLPPSTNDALLSTNTPSLLTSSKYPFLEYAACLLRIRSEEHTSELQ